MASAVARRSVMTASRMGRASIEAPTESILELAKQDLNTQKQKAKVGYKYGLRPKSYKNNSDYSHSYDLEGSVPFREKNPAWGARNTRVSRVGHPRNKSRVERPASNTHEPRALRDRFKPANRFTKGPAPRCHGKAFKRESLLTRGINKIKKSLFGLKVVPRRLAVKQSPIKKCLNAYGFNMKAKPGSKSTSMATTSSLNVRDSTSKIPIPVSSVSRRKQIRSFFMDNDGYTRTSMAGRDRRGTMRASQGSSVSSFVDREDRRNFQEYDKTRLSGSNWRHYPSENFSRRYSNPQEVSSSYNKSQAKRCGGLCDERRFDRKAKAAKYPNRHSTGMVEAFPRETRKLLARDGGVTSGKGRNGFWDSFDRQHMISWESSKSSLNRKQPNTRPSLIGLNSKTSRDLALIGVDSPMSSHGSWEGYECEHEATSDHVRPLSENLRPISENLQLSWENLRPLADNLRLPSEHASTSESVRPLSLELDEKAMSLPERRSRLEKDLDALMESMEKVLSNPVSPVHEFNPGTWPRKMTRDKQKGMPVMFGTPVFEAVI